jgi:PhoPQ-activated pathogenicity-related protein
MPKKTVFTFLILLFFGSHFIQAQQSIKPENALIRYLNNNDQSFKWEIKDTFKRGDATIYNILLTSQQWRDFTWTHQLTVIVPEKIQHDGALLFISGGSNKDSLPNWNSNQNDQLLLAMENIATDNHALVGILKQTPNQPFFNGLTEDALISYTLHNFKKDKDYSWPLLFPMVKSASKAMDAIQGFSKEKLQQQVSRFVVTGFSKRGWTSWLTGAVDQRVVAIAPMVIDILNMPVSLQYQMKTWGDYSVEIEDYVKLGIPQNANTPEGTAITTMIDPYAYRQKLTIPKLIFMGTNDPYWVVDNIKNYLKDIPGTNMLHYVPNAGHDLAGGQQAMQALSSFYSTTLNKTPYTVCSWKESTTSKGVKLSIKATPDALVDVTLWTADSSDQDLRNDKWTGKSLGIKSKANFDVLTPFPASGFRAFYVDLKYRDQKGKTYTKSTRVYLTNNKGIL